MKLSEVNLRPLDQLQKQVETYLTTLDKVIDRLGADAIHNFWTYSLDMTYTLDDQTYDIKESAYQVIVKLITSVCSHLLALIPLTEPLRTINFPRLAEFNIRRLNGFYTQNMARWNALHHHILIQHPKVKDILEYSSLDEFLDRFMDEKEREWLETKLDAEYQIRLNKNLKQYIKEAKKKEGTREYQIHKRKLIAELDIQRGQELIQIIRESITNPEKRREKGEVVLQYDLTLEEIENAKHIFAKKEELMHTIEQMQDICSVYIHRYCIPMLRNAIILLRTPYTLLFAQRQKIEFDIERMYAQTQSLGTMVKEMGMGHMPEVLGDKKPKQQQEVLYGSESK